MLPFFGPKFGNAASRSHRFGWEAEQAVELARRRVAALAGAQPRDIVFTSGATESNNLALKGVPRPTVRRHIVTMATEHPSVLDPLRHATPRSVTILPPRPDGLARSRRAPRRHPPRDRASSASCTPITKSACVQPIREIGAICREKGVLFHCDAAQAFGKTPARCRTPTAYRPDVPQRPQNVRPQGRRRALRSPRARCAWRRRWKAAATNPACAPARSTSPPSSASARPAAICAREMAAESARAATLRDRLLRALQGGMDASIHINGSLDHRLPGNLNVSFPGISAETLLMCSSRRSRSPPAPPVPRPPPIPAPSCEALGISADLLRSSVRFGIGRFNTAEEIDYAAARILESVDSSPLPRSLSSRLSAVNPPAKRSSPGGIIPG